MKKSLLIKLHIYCGLFTCFYLISLGVSSIVLNHKWDVDRKELTKAWDMTTVVDSTLDNQALANNLRDQLGAMGWTPYWRFKRDDTAFHFSINHFGKNTDVTVNLQNGHAEVKEYRKGFLAVLHGMHFFNGQIPNGNWILRSFAIYQYLALLTLLVSLILGLWLWIKFSYQTWEMMVFGGLFLISTLIMILI